MISFSSSSSYYRSLLRTLWIPSIFCSFLISFSRSLISFTYRSIYPSNTPSSVPSQNFLIFTLITKEMYLVMSLMIPIRSTPFKESLTRNDRC